MNARIAGFAAIAGGALTIIALPAVWLLRDIPEEVATIVSIVIFLTVEIALLVALIGLSAVQGRRRPVLTWSAVAVPLTAVVVSLVGMAGMAFRGDAPLVAGLSSWYLWSFGLLGLIIGSVLFAAATAIVGVFSRPGAFTLLAGSVVLVVSFVPAVVGLFDSEPVMVVAVIGLLLSGGGWIWLGYAAATQQAVEVEASAG